MGKFKVFIYLLFFAIACGANAQPVDTITFRFEPDVATYRVRCHAQKVIGTDTTFFTLADTVNSAYILTWGGDVVPLQNDIPRVTYEFTAPGIYSFALSVYEDATGLTHVDTLTYNIRDIIRVPNVFTPNDDGVNDLFIIRANGLDVLDISIYSRTGTLVFQKKAPIIVWDGRSSSGALVSQGVYYYILTSDAPGVTAQKGFFHLYDPKD